MKTFALSVFAVLLLTSAWVYAQRVEDYTDRPISVGVAEFRPLTDGGFTGSSCASVTSANGQFGREGCVRVPYHARNNAQRNAFRDCVDYGERIWAKEFKIRVDAGVP